MEGDSYVSMVTCFVWTVVPKAGWEEVVVTIDGYAIYSFQNCLALFRA
jgi:hypothetical protein